jgi:hypothetical protein
MRVEFNFWPGTPGSKHETPEHDAGEPDELELAGRQGAIG